MSGRQFDGSRGWCPATVWCLATAVVLISHCAVARADGGEGVVNGVAVTYIADYFKEGRATEFTVVTDDADGQQYVFTSLPEGERFVGSRVSWRVREDVAASSSKLSDVVESRHVPQSNPHTPLPAVRVRVRLLRVPPVPRFIAY